MKPLARDPISDGPAACHAARMAERRLEVDRLDQRDRRLSLVRGGVAALALLLWALLSPLAAAVGLGAAGVAFVVLVIVHESVARRLARARRRVEFHENALARTRGEWSGRGEPGMRFMTATHPNADDLDLFGRGSLYERLCTARTYSGQDRLAEWLRHPAAVDVIRERQAAVAELAPRVDLREDLAVFGSEARRAVDSVRLRRWAQAPEVAVPHHLQIAGYVVSIVAFVAFYGWIAAGWGPWPFYLATIGIAAVSWAGRAFSSGVLGGIGRPAEDLQTLSDLFDRLVTERFRAALLARLHARLEVDGVSPARPIARLRRWLEIHDSKRNVLFAPIAFYLLWDLQLAAAIEGWRRRFGTAIDTWLETLGELEVLVSLGAYTFENPGDPFPAFVETGPVIEAVGLAHPLIAEARAVRNDLHLDASRQMLVVTGSNMSGKSTLLRTVGINSVLAQAGAPVRAVSLRLSVLCVGASIRVHDSLQDGESRFYAEIKRIRQVMDLARGPVPLLFLLDELFDGTNSAERRAGAEAVVNSLLGLRAIGLVTSHDLALAEIAERLAPRAANVHFEDHMEGERITFDYRLKPGPVSHGNALRLMRAVGLDV